MARAGLLTPPGRSAIAVVLVEGEDAAGMLLGLGAAPLPRPGGFSLRTLDLGPGLADRVLVVATPRGFEVHLHGNPLLVEHLRRRCGEAAEDHPDSLRDEILAVAAAASTRLGLRHGLAQLGQAGLEGLGQDLARTSGSVAELVVRCERALAAGRALAPLFSPPRVVLRGDVNAGKSTLFNLLVGRDRVRTGPERALTRDDVEEIVVCEGWPVRLVDTAGEAEAVSEIDRLALERARAAARDCDLVVWVAAATSPEPTPEPGPGLARLWTHSDLAPAPGARKGEPILDFSAPRRGSQRQPLARWLRDELGLAEPEQGPAWLTERQRDVLEGAGAALRAGDDEGVRAAGTALLAPDG